MHNSVRTDGDFIGTPFKVQRELAVHAPSAGGVPPGVADPGRPRGMTFARPVTELAIFLGEYILQPDFQARQDRFKLVEGDVVFAAFDPVKGCV